MEFCTGREEKVWEGLGVCDGGREDELVGMEAGVKDHVGEFVP
jgi:hypothetical protein